MFIRYDCIIRQVWYESYLIKIFFVIPEFTVLIELVVLCSDERAPS